jgi:hypothetical protein
MKNNRYMYVVVLIAVVCIIIAIAKPSSSMKGFSLNLIEKKYYVAKARKGDAHAINKLCRHYFLGESKDIDKGGFWAAKLAECNDPNYAGKVKFYEAVIEARKEKDQTRNSEIDGKGSVP